MRQHGSTRRRDETGQGEAAPEERCKGRRLHRVGEEEEWGEDGDEPALADGSGSGGGCGGESEGCERWRSWLHVLLTADS